MNIKDYGFDYKINSNEGIGTPARITAVHKGRFAIGNTAQSKAHGLLEYYSVSLPKKSRQGVSLTLIYLYNLTKNLAAQSAHLNYAVLPIVSDFGEGYAQLKGKEYYYENETFPTVGDFALINHNSRGYEP